jgi:hypothetical protein
MPQSVHLNQLVAELHCCCCHLQAWEDQQAVGWQQQGAGERQLRLPPHYHPHYLPPGAAYSHQQW